MLSYFTTARDIAITALCLLDASLVFPKQYAIFISFDCHYRIAMISRCRYFDYILHAFEAAAIAAHFALIIPSASARLASYRLLRDRAASRWRINITHILSLNYYTTDTSSAADSFFAYDAK